MKVLISGFTIHKHIIRVDQWKIDNRRPIYRKKDRKILKLVECN